MSAFWCLGLRKACSPKPLGKYKSHEWGALSSVFVELELLLREKGVGEGEEGERESDGTRNQQWAEWPWDRTVGPSWALQVGLLYFPCLSTPSLTLQLESFHVTPNCSHLNLKLRLNSVNSISTYFWCQSKYLHKNDNILGEFINFCGIW